MVGLMVNSKRVCAKGALPVPRPSGDSLLTHPPLAALQHRQLVSVQSPVGSSLLSSGSFCMQNFVCALQNWSLCYPQSSERPLIKSRWPSGPDSLGIPSPFVLSPDWEARRGAQNLHDSARASSVLLFSSLWVPHWQVWDSILSWLCPSCHLSAAPSLSLDTGYPFLVVPSILLSMAVAILVLSEEMSAHPFTPLSWTWSLYSCFRNIVYG